MLQVGLTTEGKPVVVGIYRFYETVGMPLEMVVSLVHQRGGIPCWTTLVEEMRKGGLSDRKIRGLIESVVQFVYDRSFGDVVLQRLGL